MKILMLIPEAFYSTRGTPMSAYHRIREILKLGHEVEILTYPFGDEPPGLHAKVYRSSGPHFAKGIKQGPSYPKIWFDGMFFLNLIFLLFKKHYDLVYAHEEAAFMYALISRFFKIPFVYDMHSSLPLQIKEWGFSRQKIVSDIFRWVERFSLKRSCVAVAISPGVAEAARQAFPDIKVFILANVFEFANMPSKCDVNRLRAELGIGSDQKVVLYTGSFVALQSLELLINSVPHVIEKIPGTKFVLVGGKKEEIEGLKTLVDELGINEHVLLLTARPQGAMPVFIAASDVLVSPRVRGINPPGKLVSYLHSGKPIVVTDCYVHNQLVDSSIAILANPDPKGFGDGIIKALTDREFVGEMVIRAKEHVDANFSQQKVGEGYREVIRHIESFQNC